MRPIARIQQIARNHTVKQFIFYHNAGEIFNRLEKPLQVMPDQLITVAGEQLQHPWQGFPGDIKTGVLNHQRQPGKTAGKNISCRHRARRVDLRGRNNSKKFAGGGRCFYFGKN